MVFDQHFFRKKNIFCSYLSREVMLDAFARSPNMLDQHSCKNDVNFIEVRTF